MQSLISDILKESLYIQYIHEVTNAHIYLYAAGFLKNKGLNNLASLFMGQYNEELSHSIDIFNFLTDLNIPISVGDIQSVDFPINSIQNIAEKYYTREVETTNSLAAIKQQAIDEGNVLCEEFMRSMIAKQQRELEEANDFNDKAELCGNNWFNVLLWDLGLK